jgi:L-ascorbate metabolism protein UlaG (beta-lactamase superfamily)
LGRTIVIDPFDETVGYGRLRLRADAVLITHDHFDHNYFRAVRVRGRGLDLVNTTGETSVAVGLPVAGIASFHDNEQGTVHGPNIIYKFVMGGLIFLHLGDIGQDVLTSDQVKQIGPVDVVFIPVGGVTTIDAGRAKAMVDQLKPKAVFPMHYGDIRFYRLAPITTFLSLFPEDQRRTVEGHTVRLRSTELGTKPVVYKLDSTQTN